ncbi:MAG: murI, partial [Rhodoferax sp.]|nr:murI [Rhodoferax sp.]
MFDSGIGGLSVLRALRAELPQEDFIYLDDSLHAPYGERGDAHVIARAEHITQQLCARDGIKALVIACNTATMAAVGGLRALHPNLPIIGVEPALKPAAAWSRTRRVGVMATRGTVESPRFAALRRSLADQVEFVVQACDGLADAVQHSIDANDEAPVIALCASHLAAMNATEGLGGFGSAPGQIDTLVLGCTHYVFAEAHLARLAGPEVRILSTGEPVARRTRQVLQAADALAGGGVPGRLQLRTSGEPAAL